MPEWLELRLEGEVSGILKALRAMKKIQNGATDNFMKRSTVTESVPKSMDFRSNSFNVEVELCFVASGAPEKRGKARLALGCSTAPVKQPPKPRHF